MTHRSGDGKQLTVVLPVYQESHVIEETIKRVREVVEPAYESEIIVADDGSTDRCGTIVEEMKNTVDNLRYVRHSVNVGRGHILTEAFRRSRGDILCYIDADLEIDPEVVLRLAGRISDGFDVAIGSKHHPDSDLRYPQWRLIQSLAYNKLARRILHVDVHDFQCGAKALRREAALQLLDHLTCTGWSWDTELILKATVLGYRLAELPVTVRHRSDRRSSVRACSVFTMGAWLIVLRAWLQKRA
jgi:glycosyltransferase involved in cell wall biosynthesis